MPPKAPTRLLAAVPLSPSSEATSNTNKKHPWAAGPLHRPGPSAEEEPRLSSPVHLGPRALGQLDSVPGGAAQQSHGCTSERTQLQPTKEAPCRGAPVLGQSVTPCAGDLMAQTFLPGTFDEGRLLAACGAPVVKAKQPRTPGWGLPPWETYTVTHGQPRVQRSQGHPRSGHHAVGKCNGVHAMVAARCRLSLVSPSQDSGRFGFSTAGGRSQELPSSPWDSGTAQLRERPATVVRTHFLHGWRDLRVTTHGASAEKGGVYRAGLLADSAGSLPLESRLGDVILNIMMHKREHLRLHRQACSSTASPKVTVLTPCLGQGPDVTRQELQPCLGGQTWCVPAPPAVPAAVHLSQHPRDSLTRLQDHSGEQQEQPSVPLLYSHQAPDGRVELSEPTEASTLGGQSHCFEGHCPEGPHLSPSTWSMHPPAGQSQAHHPCGNRGHPYGTGDTPNSGAPTLGNCV
ncbi:hypothetical protein TREES_T100016002 [Tupaia chinensis]|uniref:Uncharacterized protein n=1 Tax=Tupaia chinensis TaxID=246437 RepID=L9KLV7_TUPCH|nr:hypothetical protein TREES_T100016002 [Tupaia chinensis]